MPAAAVPVIDVSTLLSTRVALTAAIEAQICEAARGIGFLVVTGVGGDVRMDGPLARDLLAVFSLTDVQKLGLARRKYRPENPLVYRGYFPVEPGAPSYKEGIDIGVHAHRWPASSDPLSEVASLPDAALLPRFRPALSAWTDIMERLGNTLLRVLAAGAGLDPDTYAREFDNGASTFRLLHYPVRPMATDAEGRSRTTLTFAGQERIIGTGEHTDSGGLTLLVQDNVGGLQVLDLDRTTWHDVPPVAGSVIVNLGDLMELWSGGLYRATPHRVLASGRERFSIPYFYEPRYTAMIRPPNAAPFTYRQHLVRKIAGFTEFKGVVV